MKEKLFLKIKYNIETDTFVFESNIKEERIPDILSDAVIDFKMSHPGERDTNKPEDKDEYTITITLDLRCDKFTFSSDTGNLDLTAGILLQSLSAAKKQFS